MRDIRFRPEREYVEGAACRIGRRVNANGMLRFAGRQARQELLLRFMALRVLCEGKHFRGKPGLQEAAHGAPGKVPQPGDHAVRRENRQPFAVRVDERHHRGFVGRIGDRLAGARSGLIAEIQRGFIAVMAIGDHQLLIRHRLLDCRDPFWLGNRPQAVDHAVFIGQLRDRGLRAF